MCFQTLAYVSSYVGSFFKCVHVGLDPGAEHNSKEQQITFLALNMKVVPTHMLKVKHML